MSKWQTRLWRELGPDSWWVWLFLLCCLLGLRIATERREGLLASLSKERVEVAIEIDLASARQNDLQRQIQSQSDPAWIELTLMRWLGLVPKGQTKVYFEEPK